MVHRIVTNAEFARFELAEDLTDHHHHHLVCTECGAISDFTVPDHLEAAIDALAAGVAERSGFVVERHRLDLFGRCATCR